MLYENFPKIIGDAQRVLVLWDAHGFDIAELVLGHIMPLLTEREHVVIMHDISDLRYKTQDLSYGDAVLWKGQNWAYATGHYQSRVYLGWISTIVDQAISVLDFMVRNHGELQSADNSYHQEIGKSEERLEEMQRVLSRQDWNMVASWAYFTLNTLPRPYTFPRFDPPKVIGTTLESVASVSAIAVPSDLSAPKYGSYSRLRIISEQHVKDTKTVDLFKIVVNRIYQRFRLTIGRY